MLWRQDRTFLGGSTRIQAEIDAEDAFKREIERKAAEEPAK
jgi:hypothetical protein